VRWTDERIQSDKEALSRAAELGALPDGWEDQLSYKKHNIEKYYQMAKNMG
jgi:hypothetical protein